MIITIVSIKGGAGKSTLAINLASILSELKGKENTFLIDCDPQETINLFRENRNEAGITQNFNSAKMSGKSIQNDVKELEKKYSYIVMDTAGADSIESRISMTLANIVLMPIYPSDPDLASFENTLANFMSAKAFNANLKGYALITRANPNPFLQGKIEALKEQIANLEIDDLNLASSIIYEREVYRNAFSKGLSVIEMPESNNKAKDEIISLYREIMD